MTKKALLPMMAAIILCSLVSGTEPPRLEAQTLIIPPTTDGTERTQTSWFKPADDYYLYSWEQDPHIGLQMRYKDNQTIILTYQKSALSLSAANKYDIEICTDQPQIGPVAISTPQNCKGTISYHDTIYAGTPYILRLSPNIKAFEVFIGEGAGAGGGVIGCSIGWSILSLTSSVSPSGNKYSETQFTHRLGVVISAGLPGGSCALNFMHKPASRYQNYASSYTPYYTNSQAKISSGSTTNPLTITASGNYDKLIKCGGTHGTLYLGSISGGKSAYTTISCLDNVNPAIQQLAPPNDTITFNTSIDFRCNATDNTALRTIELWGNFTGDWQLEASQAYTGLTYSATKTFSETLTPGRYVWACKAEDTNNPINDEWTGNWTIFINSTAAEEEAEPIFPSIELVQKLNKKDSKEGYLGPILLLVSAPILFIGIHKRKKENEQKQE